MEKQLVVRLLRGYLNCCSNKWKIIYIMKKDLWVIVRLQYFSCCSTIRKYFVKIFTHFESDLKVIVKYLMGHWSCWLFNTFACKYEKSTISWLKSHQYSICYMEEQNYPQNEKSHFILTVIWYLESFQKTLFTARTIHMLLWKNWSSWKGSERIESTRIWKKSIS